MQRKVFVISLHRTGTQSVHDLFLRLGLSAVHWPRRLDGIDYQRLIVGREDDPAFIVNALAPVFARATAFSDVPFPALYHELDRRFPSARFLAIRRNASDWVGSVRRHVGDRTLDPFEKAQYFRYLPSRPERIADVSDDELIDVHRKHYQGLANYFAARINFALLDLSDATLGERICKFLGRTPIPLRHVDRAHGAMRR